MILTFPVKYFERIIYIIQNEISKDDIAN